MPNPKIGIVKLLLLVLGKLLLPWFYMFFQKTLSESIFWIEF